MPQNLLSGDSEMCVIYHPNKCGFNYEFNRQQHYRFLTSKPKSLAYSDETGSCLKVVDNITPSLKYSRVI
jgi:hypothetical protein